jgi:hypothetical protein
MSHHVGSDLCYWIVTDSGQVVSKTSVEHVTREDYLSEDTKMKVKDFERKLGEHLDDSNFILQGEDGINLKMLEDLDDDGVGAMAEDGIILTEEEYDDMIVEEHPHLRLMMRKQCDVDRYLNTELMMGAGTDDKRWGQVIKPAKSIGGEPVGHAHANPFFDIREYEVEFMDGTIEQYTTNVISDSMYAHVDNKGNMYQLLDEIMDHKKDDMVIDIANDTVTWASGNVKPKITTQGWQLLMMWKDKSMSWVMLKDLKASNPVELAEYVVVNQIAEELAFKWWVSITLHKQNHIISKVKKKYWRTMQSSDVIITLG